MRPIRFNSKGFTIIEILVVVAIIAVLISIIVPSIGMVQRNAQKAAAVAQLGALRNGLTQYFSDFNMYPPSTPGNGIAAGRGDSMLAEGLLGYLPGSTGSGVGADGAGVIVGDSNDYGFRLTRNGTMGGKVYGPYAPTDPKGYSSANKTFIDPWGHAILYYRSTRSGTADSSWPNVKSIFGTGAANDYYFNSADCSAADNPAAGVPPGASAFNALIGPPAASVNNTPYTISNGVPGPSGAIIGSGGYLLISAGPDEKYFTADDIVVSQ